MSYRTKLIQFFKVFIHYNGYPNDNEYHLFHLHIADYFNEEDQDFYLLNLYDQISRDFAKIMAKIRNNVQYNPSHVAIVQMCFIDTFNNSYQQAQGFRAPHGLNNEHSNDDGDEEGGNGGDKISMGIQLKSSQRMGSDNKEWLTISQIGQR